MGRLRLLVVSFALVVAAPATAAAQGRAIERSTQSLKVQGAIEVEFRGTAEAGCAAAVTCDVGGTVSYAPGGEGRLFRTTFRRADGSLRRDANAFIFGFGGFGAAGQAIGISRRGDQQCVDARASNDGSLDARIVGSRLELGLVSPQRSFGFGGGGDPLRTRCAGPRADEVLAALGTRQVSLTSADGGRTVSFAATAPFSAGGFAGTVRSSVRIVLDRARRQTIRRRTARRRRSAPRRVRQTRQVTVPLRLVRIEGDATLGIAGDPATCRRLDACGITGTTTIAPRPPVTRTFFSLSVRSPSRSAALAAVGLGTGRAAPVVFGGGGAGWSTDRGRVSTRLERDGVLSCNALADAPGGGSIELRVDRASRRLRVRLLASGLGASRCPGPLATDLAATEPQQGGPPVLASGSIPLTALRRPRQTVALTDGGTLTGPGYTGSVHSDLRVVLERGRVRLRG